MENLQHFEPSSVDNNKTQLVHDLRGPLNVVLMAAEMIERKRDKLDPEYVHKQMTRIIENAQKLNDLIEKIREI